MTIRNALIVPALIAASLATATSASADDGWRRKQIDAEQRRLTIAIEHGRYKGALTRGEYRDLTATQSRIADLERRALADGYVSTSEFRSIRNAQAQAWTEIKSSTSNHRVALLRTWLYRHR